MSDLPHTTPSIPWEIPGLDEHAGGIPTDAITVFIGAGAFVLAATLAEAGRAKWLITDAVACTPLHRLAFTRLNIAKVVSDRPLALIRSVQGCTAPICFVILPGFTVTRALLEALPRPGAATILLPIGPCPTVTAGVNLSPHVALVIDAGAPHHDGISISIRFTSQEKNS